MLLLFEYVLKASGNCCARAHHDRYAFVVLLFALAILSSCAGLKKSPTKTTDTKEGEKVGVVSDIDSATASLDSAARDIKETVDDINETVESAISDVGDFFGGLLGTKKDSVMLVPPEPKKSPAVSSELPGSDGFLTTPIKREVEFDSLGNVTVSDEFLGADADIALTQSTDEYLAQRLEEGASEGLRDAAVKRTATLSTPGDGTTPGGTDAKTEGGGLLSEYGQVSIPIPPSIVPTIFGKPSINLRVNGDVAVHLAYRDNKFLATTGAFFSGSETGLDFRQEVNMSISGSVGDKIKLSTDFGSLRQFSFENLFKLQYQGYPDEIIQSIEAGNISLNTPSKYVGIQSALFGFKAVNRFGPLYLTAVAAQKKGERQNKNFGGGPGSSTGNEYNIQPSNYRRNTFFLDTSFISRYEQYYSQEPPDDSYPDLIKPRSVRVWKTTTQQSIKRALVYSWYSLPPTTPVVGTYGPPFRVNATGKLGQSGYFELLDTNQYRVDHKTGVLTLYQEPSDIGQFIAVSYIAEDGRQYGEEGIGKDTVVLKLIKGDRAFTDTSTPTFKNVLKNSYYVGATNVDASGFVARITYTFPNGQVYDQVRAAQGNLKSISVTGLDRYTNSSPGIKTPDAQIDLFSINTIILDKRTGTLTFPYLQPFGRRILDFHREQRRIDPNYRADSTFYMPEIYSLSADFVKQHVEKNNKININVKYTGGTSSTLNLNAFNIVEGSVRVTAGGRQLQEGVDYKVDINSGTVTLLKPDLATAGAVNVEFDQHDFFTTSTKTLLGLRGDIPILDKGLIGFSLLNYSLKLPTIKTRQGEEPLSNWVLGGDASYKFSVPALTSALNFLPIFNLKDKSEILFKADMALSLPNPNTQSSPMGVDSGKSIAYLDDFEGGKNDFPLQMRYGAWVHASAPVADSTSDNLYGLSPEEVNRRKSKIFWFNREPADVQIKEIKPNRSTATAGQPAQVFDIIYDPGKFSGIYNPLPADPAAVGTQDRWSGLMQYNQGLNVQSQNTEAIEFWVRTDLDGGNSQGHIMLDIGSISEDVIPDGRLQTEDKNNNGRYDPGEDIGMDVITNDSEKIAFPAAADQNDPSNDNYFYETGNYDNINGTEFNKDDFGGPYPNTEDLDANSAVNLDNSYFEYKIPLDRTNNRFIIGQSPDGRWAQYRIPLSDFSRVVGNPDRSFSSISYYRLWFTDFTDRLHLRFHEINLVGSQWTRKMTATAGGAIDSTFEVTYVNIEDNAGAPTNYEPPPGAERDKLAGQSAVVLGNEQSINLRLKCVPTGERREATRVFQSPNDLFNYRSMAVWVHGDDKMPVAAANDTFNTVWVSIRFGIDANNFYEYRRPLSKGWQNMYIDFRRLSNLKASKRQAMDIAEEAADPAIPGSMYRVVGTPTITNVPIFTLGIENRTADNCLATDVWFDELRLLEANDQIDYAMNGSVQAKLAEFGTITANIVNERPDFHRVDERFNVQRSLNFAWGITGEFQMQKIFPTWLERGSVFPLTISHTETITKPKFVFNNDIEIESAVKKIQERVDSGFLTQPEANRLSDSVRLTNQTLTVRNSIGATGVKFNFPGSFFVLPAFLNRLTYGFGFGEEFTRSPQYEYNRAWSWTGSILYDLNTGIPKLQVSPFKAWLPSDFFSIGRYSNYTLNFLPQKLSLAFSTTRGRKSYLDNIAQVVTTPDMLPEEIIEAFRSRVPVINRTFTTNRAMNFSWKLTENGFLSPQIDYSLDVASNLGDLETTVTSDLDSSRFRQRSFSAILDDIFMKDGALVRLGNDNLAVQKFRLTTNPRLPWLFWIDKFIRPLFSYNVEYRWNDAQTREQNAKTGNWFNTITTGVELNLRELGLDIFGRPEPAAPARGRNRDGGQVPADDPNRVARVEDTTPEEAFPPGGALEARPQGRSRARRIGDAAPPPLPGSTLIDSLRKSFGVTEIDTSRKGKAPGVGTGGERNDLAATDTLLIPKEPPKKAAPPVEEEPGTTIADIARAVIQKPFFDWNGTRFNFLQNNSSTNRALQGVGSGISNFFAKGIFSPEDDGNGPSRAYQLGLITDPHGRLLIDFVPQFPFVKFNVRHGDRARSPVGRTVDVTDVFTQKNTFELITSRPLWAGAQLNLSWKTEFTFDQRNTLRIDALGKIDELYVAKTGDVSRTFLSIPPLFDLSKSGIKRVGEKWLEKSNEAGYTTNEMRDTMSIELRNKLQVSSFMEGFETLPMFASKLREYLPRLNYSFSWAGLEKTFLFSWADRATFRHGYSGNYKRQFRLNPDDSIQLTTLQIVTHGFRPLAALDLGWDKVWDGRMTANLNYDTQTEWGADYTSNRITKRLSTTFSINANFQKEGLKVPFFNINLKNTFGLTFLFSQTISSDVFYQFNTILDNLDGTGNGGITKTVIEPRFSYDFSQQLTIEGFYRYERTIPAATGVLIPPTRLILAGFDIRLKIF